MLRLNVRQNKGIRSMVATREAPTLSAPRVASSRSSAKVIAGSGPANLPPHKHGNNAIEKRALNPESGVPSKTHSYYLPLLYGSDEYSACAIEGTTSEVFVLSDSRDGKESGIFKPLQSHAINEVVVFNMFPDVVPATRLGYVEQLDQFGSVQQFVRGSTDCEDLGPGLFSTEDVHRIAILDMCTLNCDRHSGNLLFTLDKRLVPVDHALALPNIFEDKDKRVSLAEVTFEWLMYSQSKSNFSDKEKEYIQSLDISKFMRLMAQFGLSNGQRMSVLLSTILLKTCALELDLSVKDIGSLFVRPGDRSKPSVFEKLVGKALRHCDKKFLAKGVSNDIVWLQVNFIGEVTHWAKSLDGCERE